MNCQAQADDVGLGSEASSLIMGGSEGRIQKKSI